MALPINREDNSVLQPMMGKSRRAGVAGGRSRRHHQGRGGACSSYERIVCAAAVAYGCLCRGVSLAAAAPLGRPTLSSVAAGEGGGGAISGPAARVALFETPGGGGGSSREEEEDADGGGIDRDALPILET